jgi:hypothetical protein
VASSCWSRCLLVAILLPLPSSKSLVDATVMQASKPNLVVQIWMFIKMIINKIMTSFSWWFVWHS